MIDTSIHDREDIADLDFSELHDEFLKKERANNVMRCCMQHENQIQEGCDGLIELIFE